METGTRLGPYEILEQLGAGGMGEVWLAEDTRLHRKVAIKVLPQEYAADPERLARFEQEARAAAALNHPNIAAVHDVGAVGTTHYIVQEYLEGQSLRDLLRDDPPKLERALTIGAEVAEALAVAHQAGIVHRDIKPDNIFITDAGHTKVVDFGLAKLVEPGASGSSPDATMSPTVIGTMAGAVMGTVGYMAPEQVEAGEIDGRTDIFALGCVLYEMTTGQRPFQGENIHTTLGRIVSSDPEPVRSLRAELPLRLDWIIAKCLAKNPALRSQTAGDLAVDLRALAVDVESGTAMPLGGGGAVDRASGRTGPTGFWTWASGLAIVGLLIGFVAGWSASPASNVEGMTVSFALDAPDPTRLPDLSLSPDGTRLAFTAAGPSGQKQLWIRSFESEAARSIPGAEGASFPFWSPEGDSVAFFQQGALMKVDLTTDAIQKIADAAQGRGGTWNRDDVIVFAPAGSEPLYQVSAMGGQSTAITELDSETGAMSHRFPRFLPDGRRFMYWEWGTETLFVESLDASDRVALRRTGTEAFVVPGYLLFVDQSTLMIESFDEQELRLGGDAVPLYTHMAENMPLGNAEVSVSATGVFAYRRRPPRETQLVWFSREGQRLGTVGDPGEHTHWRLSPDGKHVVLERGQTPNGQSFLWTLDLASGTYARFGEGEYPSWHPDNAGILFRAGDPADRNINYRQLGTSSGESDWSVDVNSPMASSFDSDGKHVAHTVFNSETSNDLAMISVEDRESRTLFVGPGSQLDPHFSPRGNWLAYSSDETGAVEVYAISYPGLDRVLQVSNSGGAGPLWRDDGAELFYLRSDGALMSVAVTDAGFGNPTRLFEAPADTFEAPADTFGVTDGGQRFLFGVPTGESLASEIHVVLNWFEELKERVPTGR